MKRLTCQFAVLSYLSLFTLIIFPRGETSAQDSWSQATDMPTARGGYSIGTVDGMIYVSGGAVFADAVNLSEKYDPITDNWTKVSSMINSRQDFSGCGMNGKIYAIGGWRSPNTTFSKTEEYDPSSNTWTITTLMPTARWGHATCSVNGKIYVIGGAKGWPIEKLHETIEVYDPDTDSWETGASIPTPRWTPSCGVVDGKIYVIGGHSESGVVRIVEEYDPATDTWATKNSMPTARWGLAAAVVHGKIYAIGGGDKYPPTKMYAIVEEYIPSSDNWTTKSPMPAGRILAAACAVNGKIYVPGGLGLDPIDAYSELYIYDPGGTGVENNPIKSDRLNLHIIPNPFSTTTTIEYELTQAETVTITFFNQLGKHVDTIEQKQLAGEQEMAWSPENLDGGIYYFKLQAGEQVASGKVVLMR